VSVRADAPGLDPPLVHGCGDVAGYGVDAAGEVSGIEAASLGRAIGAFLSAIRALGDIAADAGRVGAAAGGMQVAGRPDWWPGGDTAHRKFKKKPRTGMSAMPS
jgi:hypothetical protein